MLEVNGSIFIGFGSNGCDKNAHGWLLAYSATTLQQQAVFNTSPAVTWGSSLWMSGVGPAADAENSIYLITANGTYDINTGGSDWGDTILRMTFNGSSFAVADSFTPRIRQRWRPRIWISGRAARFCFRHRLPVRRICWWPREKPGPSTWSTPATWAATTRLTTLCRNCPVRSTSIYGAPVYWNNALYFTGRNDTIKAFPFVNGVITTPPVADRQSLYMTGVPVVSANGNSNGFSGWCAMLTPTNSTTLLSAFNASTLQTNLVEIYDTQQNIARDALGTAPHFATPLVVNGRVYVGTNTR